MTLKLPMPNSFLLIYFKLKLKTALRLGQIRIVKRLPELILLKQKLKQKFPQSLKIFQFPYPQQTEINKLYAQSILQLFCTFLKSICQFEEICKQSQFLLFIENFVSQDKKKIKTFFQRKLNKKAGGRHTQSNFLRMMYSFVSWRHKFFTITNQGTFYTDNQQSFEVRQMLLFNQTFSVLHGQIKTGYTFGLIINSSHRILQVDAQNPYNFLLFIYFVKKAIVQAQSSKVNRFNSFGKVRQKCCKSKFYIDGQNYFKDLNKQLKKAQKQIFITGWFLSPHMYLQQSFQNQLNRIDQVLLNLATSGIKIYIIVYNAPKIALNIGSEFTQSYLNLLHSNIKVLKHPNYMFIPFLWSHHQKLVIIDQKIAFMGGLDIGYGRMDNAQHLLSDQSEKYWKGIQYCNYRISDIEQIETHGQSSIDRLLQPRMPWHDIGVKVQGPSVVDLTRHFIQYWNHVNFQLQLSERELILYTGIHNQKLLNQTEDIKPKQIEINFVSLGQKGQQKNQKNVNNTAQQQKNFVKTDKIKEIKTQNKDLKLKLSFSQQKTKTIYDDLPSFHKLKSTHVTISSQQQFSKQQEIQYYLQFLKENNQKIELTKSQSNQKSKGTFNKEIIPLKRVQDLVLTQCIYQKQTQPLSTSSHSSQQNYNQTHQILRSASLWSLGLEQGKQQKSILEAYYSLIQNSKNFIYLQNQFFISKQNQISTKIGQRILLAREKKEKFKVILILPFLPGFHGNIEDDSYPIFRVQVHLIYQTICRGQKSLFKMLEEKMQLQQIKNYLGIYCLRNHGVIKGIPVTQIVYVHSKLLIIDDQIVLIGSANINDRSLMGSRDSQLAVIIQDTEQIQIQLQNQNQNKRGRKIMVNKFAHQLRKKLYMEHFGLSSKQSENYFNEQIWEKMQFNSQRNQKVYRKIFGCYPDNNIKSFSDIQALQLQAEPLRYQELKGLITGFACPFQKDFLIKQNLQLHAGQKQYYIPYINFT